MICHVLLTIHRSLLTVRAWSLAPIVITITTRVLFQLHVNMHHLGELAEITDDDVFLRGHDAEHTNYVLENGKMETALLILVKMLK